MPGQDGHIGAFGLTGEYAYGRAFETLKALASFQGNGTATYNIGGTYVERLRSVSFSLQAVGGAGVRTPIVDFLDQGGVVFSGAASPFTVAAGSTSIVTFAVEVNEAGANDAPRIVVPLPYQFLQPTYSMRITISGGLVADNVTAVRVLTEQFSTAPADFAPGQGGDHRRERGVEYSEPLRIA
jgi:hypothetical protein